MSQTEILQDPAYIDQQFSTIVTHGSSRQTAEAIADIVGRIDLSTTEGALRRTLEQEPDEMVAILMDDPAASLKQQVRQLGAIYTDRTDSFSDGLGTQYNQFITRSTDGTAFDTLHSTMQFVSGKERIVVTSHLRGQLQKAASFMIDGDELRVTTPAWYRGQATTEEQSFEPGKQGSRLLIGMFTNTMLAQYLHLRRTPEQTIDANRQARTIHALYNSRCRSV